MTWCDEILGFSAQDWQDNARQCHERATEIADKLSIAELRRTWFVVGHSRQTATTRGLWFFNSYFRSALARDPERACNFIFAEVADDPDDELVALIETYGILTQVLRLHPLLASARLEATAKSSARLRWLLGSAHWEIKGNNNPVVAALLPLADNDAWLNWDRTHCRSVGDLDSASLDELASLFIKDASRSPIEKIRDDLDMALMSVRDDLVAQDHTRGLALVRAVLAKTDDQWVLGMLSASLLEDLVQSGDEGTLTAIEANAMRDPRFCQLLNGIYFTGVSAAWCARFDKLRGADVS